MRHLADQKARFCLATGVPPSDYPHLTRLERQAFLDLLPKG